MLKSDYSDFNNIVYRLFSVDQWRDAVAGIMNHQVKHFTMTKAQKKDLQIEVQQIMMALVNKAEALPDKSQTLGGKIKKLVVKTFVNKDKIKAQVPGFAKTIITKIDNPANKSKLSTMALNKFNQAQLT